MKASRWFFICVLACCVAFFVSCAAGLPEQKKTDITDNSPAVSKTGQNNQSCSEISSAQPDYSDNIPPVEEAASGEHVPKDEEKFDENKHQAIEQAYTEARKHTLERLVKAGVISKQQADALESSYPDNEILKDMSEEQKNEVEYSLEKSYSAILYALVDDGVLSEEDADTYRPYVKGCNLDE